MKMLKEDQLEWLQVSDLKGWQSEVAELYHIRVVPQNFLLNPEGMIIVTNLRGAGTKKATLLELFFFVIPLGVAQPRDPQTLTLSLPESNPSRRFCSNPAIAKIASICVVEAVFV